MTPAQEFAFLRDLQRDLRLSEIMYGTGCGVYRFRRYVLRRMAVLAVALVTVTSAAAQHRHHPVADMPLHEKFYSTWYMPDQPTKSCCNNQDCAPVSEVRFVGGHIEARRVSDGQWLRIPRNKMELNRDSPDGNSHLCSFGPAVYCFILGSGS